jgi:C-terminal processing protease CtpA/Prc
MASPLNRRFAIALLLVSGAAASDLTGRWHADVSANGRGFACDLDLKQDGNALTGTVQIEDRVLQVDHGSIQGDAISLSLRAPVKGRLATMQLEGKWDGARLHFRLENVEIVASRMQQTREEARVDRLSGLFRLWGAIHFFHPFVVHGSIDWDAALLSAIPRVEGAASSEDYRAAIETMLRELKDPETYVVRGELVQSAAGAGNRRRVVRRGLHSAGASISEYYADWERADSTPFVMSLPDGTRIAIRASEPASSTGAISAAENTYGASSPSREQRLLALARFWNTIRYFYGYPEYLPFWDSVLSEFIPVFESAKNRHDYVLAVARMAARTNDSHTSVPEFWKELGTIPAIDVWPVEGQSVVKAVGPAINGIVRGDVITAVDDEPVERRRNALLQMYPYSSPQAAWLRIDQFLLAGQADEVKIRVRKADGTDSEVTVRRDGALDLHRTTPVYTVLPAGYGYIDLERLGTEEIDTAFDAVHNTPGLILDMRGYPKGDMAGVATRLAAETRDATLIRRRTWHGPDPALATFEWTKQKVHPGRQPRYTGRVVVLIDARAVSAAEHTCLLLEAAAHPTFIGTPTKGADGEVTNIVLPGRIQVNFAALEVRHADGRLLQGSGILPDVYAVPTIAGIREGRDEVLERAVEFLRREL